MNDFEKKLQSIIGAINNEIDLSKIIDENASIGPYKIINLEGIGGQAYLFRAYDKDLERSVIIKLYKNNLCGTAKDRAVHEGKALSTLSDPRIAKCYEFNFDRENPFLVLEDVQGEPLDRYLIGKNLSLDETTRIFKEIALAIENAHKHKLLHLDIKPANVLVNQKGDIKVIDFGLTRGAIDRKKTDDSGTPAFMAPEQAAAKDVSERTDVFGLGALLFFLCTGQAPVAGDTKTEIRENAIQGIYRSLVHLEPNLPNHYIEICNRCLLKEPGDRYRNVGELLGAFDASQSVFRNRIFGLLFAVIVVAFGCLLIWWNPFGKREIRFSDVGRNSIPVEVSVLQNVSEMVVSLIDGDNPLLEVLEAAPVEIIVAAQETCFLSIYSYQFDVDSNEIVLVRLFPDLILGDTNKLNAGESKKVVIEPEFASHAIEYLWVVATTTPHRDEFPSEQGIEVKRSESPVQQLSGRFRGMKRKNENLKFADFAIPYRVVEQRSK